MNNNLVREIAKVENLANVDVVLLGVIVKSINTVFDHMKFKGKFPKIAIDNYYQENGQAEEWPSCYCNDEKKILVNISAPRNPFSCSSVIFSRCAAWAAAMYVYYERNSYKKNSKRKKNAAYKIAEDISRRGIC